MYTYIKKSCNILSKPGYFFRVKEVLKIIKIAQFKKFIYTNQLSGLIISRDLWKNYIQKMI